ncbi:MAG: hypothetical protein JSU94_06635 [Phycisphaerales bacterium]|nr:MAG: hypothetical protein JSU94_06635 [Phycisphaerales bacterium]
MELVIVLLIGGILAAIAIPMMRGRTETAKWAEANASAGIIRTAVRACIAERGIAEARKFAGVNMGSAETRSTLGFASGDLDGSYFEPDDYTITDITADGIAVVTVTGGSKPESPAGTYRLDAAGNWRKQ